MKKNRENSTLKPTDLPSENKVSIADRIAKLQTVLEQEVAAHNELNARLGALKETILMKQGALIALKEVAENGN